MDFAVGDRYRSNIGGKVWRCAFVYDRGGKSFPFFELDSEHPREPFFFDLSHIEENWTKIIPFFEKGKSYGRRNRRSRYEVIEVFEKNGHLAAMAEMYESDEFRGFIHLNKWNFEDSTEV